MKYKYFVITTFRSFRLLFEPKRQNEKRYQRFPNKWAFITMLFLPSTKRLRFLNLNFWNLLRKPPFSSAFSIFQTITKYLFPTTTHEFEQEATFREKKRELKTPIISRGYCGSLEENLPSEVNFMLVWDKNTTASPQDNGVVKCEDSIIEYQFFSPLRLSW